MDSALAHGRAVFIYAPCGFGKTTTVQAYLENYRTLYCSADSPGFVIPKPDRSWDILVIDDLHLLQQPEQQQQLCALIRDTPHRRFILLSRGVIPSWLSPFQIAGVMSVLTAQSLVMDRDTILRLLGLYGITVSDTTLTAILQETHGYPLAADLLAKQLALDADYSRTTTDRVRVNIFLYYEEAVYHRLDITTRRLLLDLAPFPRFNLEMARIVSGNSHVGEELNFLLRNTTMLIQDKLDTYRFWPFFRMFLQWELEQTDTKEQIQAIYNRGGLYYELKEDFGNALDCYSKSGDYKKVSELLRKNAEMHPGMGHYCEMEPYYLSLPEEQILASPALMQAMSMLCSIRMDYDASERWYQALAQFAQGKQRSDAAAREARGRLAWLDIALPQRSVESSIDLFQKLFRLIQAHEIQLPPFSATSTLPSLMNGGKDFSPWSKKDDLLYTTLRLPAEVILGRDGVCMPECSIAESKFEKGEDIRDRAMYLLRNLDRIRRDGTPDIEFAVVGLLARMYMSCGRPAEAHKSLTDLRARFEAAGESRFFPNLDAMLCRVDLLMNDDVAIDKWYREKAPRDSQKMHSMKRYQYITQAMAELALGEERSALLTLSPLEPYFHTCSRYIDSIHLHAVCAIARFRLKENRWQEHLEKALMTASEFGFIRTISQFGAAILPLLERFQWNGSPLYWSKLTKSTREQATFYPDYLRPRRDMSAPLSATELQVLRLLCANKSNAEIGQILDIKLATVKTHVSNILNKLGLSRRSEVKDAAQRLHLIH